MDNSHTTKSCVLILLLVLLFAKRAQGLECYHCIGVPLETSCKSLPCHHPDGFCIAQEAEIIMDSHRSKVKNNLCLPICPTNLENTEFLRTAFNFNVNTSCCKEDLCNAAVPTGGILLQTLLGWPFQQPPHLSFYPHLQPLLTGAL
uniref:UPAR/Ly6 domain-containing protein n=1 Tax=Mus spicilegus TaxID=10103 RepID=A0A8C6I381_MUSSI